MKNRWIKSLLTLLTMALVYYVSFNTTVKYTASDPQLTLLTSQALLQHGNTNLYPYYSLVKQEDFTDGLWKYSNRSHEKKIYYFYPIGTSLICMPIVAYANYLGFDMLNKKHDSLWQSIIASGTVCIVFLLLLLLANNYINYYLSWLISALFCFSTPILSTMAVALWSFNFEVIFLLLALLHLAKNRTSLQNCSGIKLGIFIYLAWLCRPSTLIVIGFIGILLFLKNKKQFTYFLLVLMILYIPFGIYSYTTYNIYLQPYYHPLYWTHMPKPDLSIWERLCAILVSPARGLFIFSPVLFLCFIGFFIKNLHKNYLFLLSVCWFAIHCLMLARQSNWWGGWSFGPRLFTDALLPLFLMLVIALSEIKKKFIITFTFIILCIPSIAIHSFVGAHNIEAYRWNDNPPIDDHIDYYIWNYGYPQFLADSISNETKKTSYLLSKSLSRSIYKLHPGDHVLFQVDGSNCEIGKRVNNIPLYKQIKLHCTLSHLEQSCSPENGFYITPNLMPLFNKDTNYVMQQTSFRTLASYMLAHKNEHIFIATKNNLLNKMSDSTITLFKNNQSILFSIQEGEGYIAHWYKNKLQQEAKSSQKEASFTASIGGKKIGVRSDGKSNASIKIMATEHCINDGGFNLVCVDDFGNVTDVARFNTYYIDAEFLYLFKFYKKHNQ